MLGLQGLFLSDLPYFGDSVEHTDAQVADLAGNSSGSQCTVYRVLIDIPSLAASLSRILLYILLRSRFRCVIPAVLSGLSCFCSRFSAPCIMAAVYAVLTVARFDTTSDVDELAAIPVSEWLRLTKRRV